MTPHERRQALLGWLRGRGAGTAQQAAQRFGVSERTILRDVEALRASGEPILSSAGPGGGFVLDVASRASAVRLTAQEVIGLALAAQLTEQAAQLPYARGASGAVDRLMATLAGSRAAELRRLLQRIMVREPASAQVSASLGQVEEGFLDTFEAAFSKQRVLSFEYVDRSGQVSWRQVEPHGLVVQQPIWYVIAHDRLRQAPRMFRVDRMRGVTALAEGFEPKPPAWFSEYLDPCEAQRAAWRAAAQEAATQDDAAPQAERGGLAHGAAQPSEAQPSEASSEPKGG